MRSLRDPHLRVVFAYVLLVVCVVMWPVSMLSFAKSEPPVVLSLSWFALILTALNILATTDVRAQQDGDGGGVTG